MKYAIVLPADQTIAYISSLNGEAITTKHPEAYPLGLSRRSREGPGRSRGADPKALG